MKHTRLKLTLTGLLLLSGPAGSFELSQLPLFVTGNFAPNLVLTLDDSGSMRRGYVPEHCNNLSDCAALDNRWAKAADGNALHYKPDVYYPAPFDANLNRRTTSFGAAWRNGYDQGAGSVNLDNNYRPTAGLQMDDIFSCGGDGGSSSSSSSQWFECHMGHYSQDLMALGAAGVSSGAKAHYYRYNSTLAGCKTPGKQENECYELVIVGNKSGLGKTDINGDGIVTAQDKDERQNFANWYSFYRTRNLAVISAASLAFANLGATSRLSWQALNTCNGTTSLVTKQCQGWSGNFGSNAIDVFGKAGHRQNFYDWLSRLPMSGDTPLREALIRAGKYFQTKGENSPYDNDLGTGNSGEYSCRRNFHILMTDGIWNDSLSDIGSIGNIDGSTITLPDEARTRYDATNKAYSDSTSDTLSDLAFKYWATDLAPWLRNDLTPLIEALDQHDASGNYGSGDGTQDTTQQIFWNARNNPATWQHMVNFTIGLGLTEFLASAGLSWSGDMYGGSYPSLLSGALLSWPPATSDMGKTGTDYGKSAHDLWHTAINSRGRFFSAESPRDLIDAFEKILSMVEAATPTGAALASNSTNTSSNTGQKTRVFQARFDTRYWNGSLYALEVDGQAGTVSGPVWDAGMQLNKLAASNGRKIFISGVNGATTLSWGNLTKAQQAALNQSDGHGSLRLNWLRGDHSKEQRFVGGLLRNRTAFELNYDGTPSLKRSDWVLGDIVASDPLYVGAGSQQYDQLPAGTPGRNSYAAYVSAKASRTPMIYVGANDGMLHALRATDGVEQFAVIPNAVFPNLHLLTRPSYTHRYYVDGSPSGGDAFLNGAWKTVVVTGLRAGGQSVFAVDATQADSPTASQFMWEFNADGSDKNMGYSYSQPQVVRLNDGNWAAVFGNGYNSQNGGVSLYIVNLADGSLIRRIEAVKQDRDNGLSTPTLVDTDGDRIVDVAYAGDLKGKVWKFDLKSGSASNWSGSEFFTAQDGSGNPQPITVQPKVAKGDSGLWIFLGTGSMLSGSDIEAAAMSKRQSFYGLWDNGSPIAGRSALVAQTVTDTTSKNGMNLRITSDHAVDLAAKRGWYMDLPSKGERVIAEAVTVIDNVNQNDNRIVFTTALPSDDPCSAQGTSWLMELSFKGRRPTKPVFDLNADLKFDQADTLNGVIPTGMQSTVGIMDSVTWLDKDANVAFKLAPGTKGKVQTITNRGRGQGGIPGRVSWQQLM